MGHDDYESGDWCPICLEYEGGSHYHCPNCKKICGMMGHLDCKKKPLKPLDIRNDRRRKNRKRSSAVKHS